MCAEECPLDETDSSTSVIERAKGFIIGRTAVMSEFIEISIVCSCGGNSCRRCIGTFIGSVVVMPVVGALHLDRLFHRSES